ncbi:hypothetical protein ACLK1T_14530 [Escherichia coli]
MRLLTQIGSGVFSSEVVAIATVYSLINFGDHYPVLADYPAMLLSG